jgi:hypothetical protein
VTITLPSTVDVDDVIVTFRRADFDASVARLAIRFVPTIGRGHQHRVGYSTGSPTTTIRS